MREVKKKIADFWNWLWHSDSIWSWVVLLVLAYVTVKFIFLPGLGLISGTSLPLLIVESSSMDHSALRNCISYEGNKCVQWSVDYEICGKSFEKKENLNFEEYWEVCGGWYEGRGLEKEFIKSFKNGFEKGDILVVIGWFKPKLGDVTIFNVNEESISPRPIVHRIVSIDSEGIIQTKGDHNAKQLIIGNNVYRTDETEITEDRVIGRAVFRIPKIGWLKLIFVEAWNYFS